jgi:Ca2+-binding RTX toxin-like protein
VTELGLNGGDLGDAITTPNGVDVSVDGGVSRDTVTTANGTDSLIGGTHGDILTGGDGPDTFDGGSGNDVIHADDGEIDDVNCGGSGRTRSSPTPTTTSPAVRSSTDAHPNASAWPTAHTLAFIGCLLADSSR